MSDISVTPPPPAPAPKKDNKLQIVAASIFALAVAIIILALVIPSSDSNDSGNIDTGSSSNTSLTNEEPPITTPVNKYDAYYEHVLNNSGQANSMDKSKVIELGDLVCEALDQGNSIAAVVAVLSNASTTSSDVDLAAAAMYGAVIYLCPEYEADLQNYLG